MRAFRTGVILSLSLYLFWLYLPDSAKVEIRAALAPIIDYPSRLRHRKHEEALMRWEMFQVIGEIEAA